MRKQVLVIGYGNPGRLDDGLGPALVDEFERLDLENVTVDAEYQLAVEDAAEIAQYDVVVFADASVRGGEPFEFSPVRPQRELSFTTHSVAPHAVVALARDMFHAEPRAFTLAIRGYEFNEFGERLSERARVNLREAVTFLARLIREDRFEEWMDVGDADDAEQYVFTITQADLN